MTTPGPRLNNESEPICFFLFFPSSSPKELCDVSHVAVSLQFPNCPEWFVLQCRHGLKRKKMSGSCVFFNAFAMPCDLRKKAALTNFLRDICLCLMFVFVSVIPLFFNYTVLTKIWTLWIVFLLHTKTKLTKLKKWSAPLLHFFLFFFFLFFFLLCSIWQQKAYYLLCNLFILQPWSILKCALTFPTTHRNLPRFFFFLVAGTGIFLFSVTLASQLQFELYGTITCLGIWCHEDSNPWPLNLCFHCVTQQA